jgi:protoheme IX farnesyltransferase
MSESGGVRSGSTIRRWLRLILELTKVRITIAVTLSVATGFFVFAGDWTSEVFLPMFGVFVLACGSAALNQVQESRVDAKMPRTRHRPIPSGRIRRDWALFIALALIGLGLSLLASIEKHTGTLIALGIAAVVWYNGVYVILKRITAFAVVPGSLIGAIPPVIGYVAAGGMVNDPAILTLAFIFFLWQIPHFWLLLIRCGDDYRQAGLPSLNQVFSAMQIARITGIWILSLATCGVLMSAAGGLHMPWSILILLASVWLAFGAVRLLLARQSLELAMPTFLRINLYMLMLMAALVGNAFT